jgi:opacity protein-like surface antigen
MKSILLAVGLAVLGSLSACAPAVNVEQRANVNFSRYRTFDFADMEVKTNGTQNPLLRSPIAQDRIKQAIAGELAKRGLRQVESSPDLLITTHTYVEQAERTVYDSYRGPGYAYPYAVGYRGAYLPINYGYWYTPAYYSSPRTERYNEGTLIIDFIDRRSNNLVWRGSLADPVDDPARLGSEFSKNAKEILDKFPVAEKKS